MKYWGWAACVSIGASLLTATPLRADETATVDKPAKPGAGTVVDSSRTTSS